MRAPWLLFLTVVVFTIAGCEPADDPCAASPNMACGEGDNPAMGTACGPDDCGQCTDVGPPGVKCRCRDSDGRVVYD